VGLNSHLRDGLKPGRSLVDSAHSPELVSEPYRRHGKQIITALVTILRCTVPASRHPVPGISALTLALREQRVNQPKVLRYLRRSLYTVHVTLHFDGAYG
jgi:hypothetical protein